MPSSARPRFALLAIVTVLAAAVASSALAVEAPVPAATDVAPGIAGADVAPASQPETTGPDALPPLPLGSDGKLTVLLMGSDFRPGYRYPEHIDVIMVASYTPATKRMVFASVPRDVVYFPRAPQNRVNGLGSTSGSDRVNTMYQDDYKNKPNGENIERHALAKFKADVAHALDVEIDAYAYIRFSGFDAMIDAIGGLRVGISGAIHDHIFSDRAGYTGIYFPAASDYFLGGWRGAKGGKLQNCLPYPMQCHRAIVYARSRKGREGSGNNSDYRRVRRQQEMVFRAAKKASGFGDDVIATLLQVGQSHVTTDLWEAGDTGTVLTLRNALKGAKAGPRVVFGPTRYATTGGSLPAWTSKLRVAEVRRWVERYMSTADD